MALHVDVLLGAERAAGRDLRHAHPLLGTREERGDLAPVVPDALALGEDAQRRRPRARRAPPPAPGTRARSAACGSSARRRARALASAASTSPRFTTRDREHVAALVEQRCVRLERLERVVDRLEHLVLDLDQRCGLARGVRVSAATAASTSPTYAVVSPTATNWRQSARSMPCVALARDVGGGHDRDRRPGRLAPSRCRCAARARAGGRRSAARRGASPATRHVADERLVAERELVGAVARARARRPVAGSGSGSGSPRRAAAASTIASTIFT